MSKLDTSGMKHFNFTLAPKNINAVFICVRKLEALHLFGCLVESKGRRWDSGSALHTSAPHLEAEHEDLFFSLALA